MNGCAKMQKSWRNLVTPEALSRLAVTLAVLIVYRIGSQWPAPGIDPVALASSMTLTTETSLAAQKRTSLFALGLNPLFTVMIVAEVLKLAFPGSVWGMAASDRSRGGVNRWVLGAALALAALQAYGMAAGFELASDTASAYWPAMVTEPGWAFRLQFMVTAVAGSALLAWLADLITRHGIGSGFWILLLATTLSSLAWVPETIGQMLTHGQIDGPGLIALAIAIPAAIAMLVTLLKATGPQAGTSQSATPAHFISPRCCIWPPIIALTFTGQLWGAANAYRQWAGVGDSEPLWFANGTVSSLVLTALLIFLLTFMMAQTTATPGVREISANGRASRGRIAFLTASALAIITCILQIAAGHYSLPVPEGGWFIAIAVTAISVLPRNVTDYFPDPAMDSNTPPELIS